MIRERTVSVRFFEEAISAGRDNGQRTCDIMDEKIEQTLLLIRPFRVQRFLLLCNAFLTMKPFQKISFFLLERIWKMYSPQRKGNPRAFYIEDRRRFSLDRDPDLLEDRYIFGSPSKDQNQSDAHRPSSEGDQDPSRLHQSHKAF